jgi:hypothetical protein
MARTVAVVGLLAYMTGGGAGIAMAFSPEGACCGTEGSCTDTTQFTCEAEGGSFIGEGTECATVNCGARIGAPVLSIFGIVAMIGALGGWGVFRLFQRRRLINS